MRTALERFHMRNIAPASKHLPLARHSTERRMWLARAGAAALALGHPWSLAWAQPASAAAEEARAPALPVLGAELVVPAIRLLDGSPFDAARHAGQPLLVYWWSSTCPFCALQSPSMEKLWQSQRGKGLQMLALSIDRHPEAASAYVKQKGYSFPAAWASPEWRKSFPKPRGLPITLLRGTDGRLLLAERGQMFAEDVDAIADLI